MTEPAITVRAAHDDGLGNTPVTRVVIHATCPDVGYSAASAPGAAHGTALYFATQAAGGSAHYVCGVDGEEHCVPERVIAWHAPPNAGSLGIEITAEGGQYANNYSRDQWLSAEVWPAVKRAAARTRDLCARYGVPLAKLSSADLLAGLHGICGHVDVSQAWHQTNHSDPGPNFPWDKFMAEVTNPTPEDDMPLTDADIEKVAQRVRQVIADGSLSYGLDTLRHRIDAVSAQVAVADANDDPSKLAAAIVAALPAPSAGGLTQADVEDALRNVLGSLKPAA